MPTHQLRVISVELTNLIIVLDDQLEFAENLSVGENNSKWLMKQKRIAIGIINSLIKELELIVTNANLLESYFKVIEDFLKTQ